MEGSIGALKDEQLEPVVGGQMPAPPVGSSESTELWIETRNEPSYLGNYAAGCPQPGCNKKALEFDGSSYINVGSEEVYCYRFHCEKCKTCYAQSHWIGIWYIKV